MSANASHWSEYLPWMVLGLLLLLGLPLFLCMPLWVDATLYDLAARNVLAGGIHYRDLFDTNLPGMVWLHAAIRSLCGWRSETLRLVDAGVVAGIIWLLLSWLAGLGVSRKIRAWMAVVLAGFYLGLPELCHCQRDVWMLLPALAALHLRWKQGTVLAGERPWLPGVFLRGAAEGALWASAFWIKPFVALPALAVWAVGLRQGGFRLGRSAFVDMAGVGVGGGLILGSGLAWLWLSGTWPYFCDVFVGWNPEYGTGGLKTWPRTQLIYRALKPWGWTNVLVVPLALFELREWWRQRRLSRLRFGLVSAPPRALMAAFYLGWLVQAVYVQKAHAYSLAPAILVGLTMLAARPLFPTRPRFALALTAAFVVIALAFHPVLQPRRLAVWGRCWSEGSTPAVRDRLYLVVNSASPSWVDLTKVADFLKQQPLRDGELTCYNNSPHPLYLDLDLRPSTPFLQFDTLLLAFPSRKETIRSILARSNQHYVVSDLEAINLTPAQATAQQPGQPLALPPSFPESRKNLFPWSEPVVFRAGRYLVHEVCGPVQSLVPENKSPRVALRR
jgi:hypothetical protein